MNNLTSKCKHLTFQGKKQFSLCFVIYCKGQFGQNTDFIYLDCSGLNCLVLDLLDYLNNANANSVNSIFLEGDASSLLAHQHNV